MRNPILQKPLWIFLYIFWWILPGSIHAFVLWKAYHISTQHITIDVLVSFVILAILGLSIWYMIRYGVKNIENAWESYRNQLWMIVLLFVIWYALTYSVLSLFLTDYTDIYYDTFVWRVLIFLPSILLLMLSYNLLSAFAREKNQQQQHLHMEAMVKEAQLSSLKAQINPHFLFNSLNSASSLTLTSPERAREMIVNISDYFRAGLLLSKNRMSPLSREMEHALMYLEIEKERFGDKLQMDIPDYEEFESIEIPSFILQPLVENAVKHGVYEASEPVYIRFVFDNNPEGLALSIINDVEDWGGASKKGTGTGLKNVHDRMMVVYDSPRCFQIEKSEHQFEVKLWFPFLDKEQTNGDTESENTNP